MREPTAAARLTPLLGAGFTSLRRIGGDHGVGHYRLTLADGQQAFAKICDQDGNAPVPVSALRRGTGGARAAEEPVTPADQGPAADDPAGLRAEAASLRWLADAAAVPVPAVLAASGDALIIEWLDAEPATAHAAALFRPGARTDAHLRR